MSTEKTSFFLQFQLLLDTYQQRSHIQTSHRVMQQYQCYYCPKEFQTFLHLYIPSRPENQNKNCQNFCMSVWLSLSGSFGNCLKPGVGTARSLLMHTWARLIGLRNLHAKRCEHHERREETGEKTKISALYTPSPGFKAILSKCMFLYVFIVTLTFDLYFLIMDNIWTKLITGLYVFHKVVSIFVHCDLDLPSLTLKIDRNHPLTMDKCTYTKSDQDYLNSLISIVFKR